MHERLTIGIKLMESSHRSKANFQVDSIDLKEADGYVHLGQEVNTHHNLEPDIARRRAAGWIKFCCIIHVSQLLQNW